MHGRKWVFAIVLVALTTFGVLRESEAQPPSSNRRVAAITPARVIPDLATPRAPSVATPEETTNVIVPEASESVSVGRSNRGRLRNGVELRESPVLRLKNPSSSVRYGTAELVGLLERSATRVAARYPGARLSIGDLSLARGGRVRPHKSHRVGRDVDVGFYLNDSEGRPAFLNRFVNIGRELTSLAPDVGRQFDVAKNWALIEALLSDERADVQYVFVARWIRDAVLAEGARVGASPETLERAAVIVQQPRHGSIHRSHFHVRIYCSGDDRPTCVDMPPFYPWVRGVPGSDASAAADAAAP